MLKTCVQSLSLRKAFDLIDHNKLLQNFEKIGVRPALLAWLGSYFQGRSQVTKVGNTFSDPAYIKGGVPQGSKIGPLAFIVHINDLPSVVQSSDDNSDTVSMFMDDTTMSEVLNVSDHISGESIGNCQCNLESVLQFTNDENMQLNLKKCQRNAYRLS